MLKPCCIRSKIRLANRTTTLAEECAREGKDYEVVLRQIAKEFALAHDLGLTVSNDNPPVDNESEEN